jgi:uncharacterized membrane protein (UPF0127 family)
MNNQKNPSGIRFKRIFIPIVIIIIVSLLGWRLFTKKDNQKTEIDNTGKQYEPSFKKEGQLAFIKKNSNETPILIAIEIADDEQERTQGLMWRQSMPDSVGMLFIFEEEIPLSFWMANTYIPLDIIFIDNKFNIVTIEYNTIPLSETLIPSRTPARYAVEVNAWFCRQHGIGVGDKIRWNRIN